MNAYGKWNSVSQLFCGGSSLEDDALPESWHYFEASRPAGEHKECLGPHVVRRTLSKSEHGRLILADFGGCPNKPVYVKHYACLSQPREDELKQQAHIALDLGAASKIRHKYLYPLKDYCAEGEVYLVFDAVHVQTLEKLIEDTALSAAEAVAMIEPLLGLADEIHSKGLILGDLNPGAIWLTKSRSPRLLTGQWILDFQSQRRAERRTAEHSSIFRGVSDDLDYLPPEILRGEAVDFATDQYLLGAVLFRLLTEKTVVNPDIKVVDRVISIVAAPPPKASQAQPLLGTAFDNVLARMLAKEPKQRFQNCTEIIPILREAVASVPG